MNLQFRTAAPEDADAVLPLILSSGPDAFDYVFTLRNGTPVIDFLRSAFLDGRSEFGYRNHTVATLDGKIAGTGASFSGDRNLAFMLAGARQILSVYGLQGFGVMVRGLRTEQILRPPARTECTIMQLGVAPEARSRGIGGQLVEHFVSRGKAAGLTKAVLDVAVTNPRAQALYESLGFTVEAERISTLRNAVSFVPSHRRMSRLI